MPPKSKSSKSSKATSKTSASAPVSIAEEIVHSVLNKLNTFCKTLKNTHRRTQQSD